ncbi:MAG: TlyA family RNA methyltransferase [Campylobacteraceae bacterium]|nr:TlyA family RNA methyltransferase [Campylobacteraceae bacterium]
MRADLYVAEVLNISRNKASELIKAGQVLLNGEILDKPSFEVDELEGNKIEVVSEIYVSRSAMKLKTYLKSLDSNLGVSLAGKTAIDVGSSAGGFIQVLLENGVKSVVGVDVGSDQINPKIKDNAGVRVCENTDIREFAKKSKEEFEILTCDVSFISLNLILESIKELFSEYAILLFKPQFEVGKEAKRDKKGVLKDTKAIKQAMAKFELEAAKMGLIMLDKKECEVLGKEGNSEYFYLFKK